VQIQRAQDNWEDHWIVVKPYGNRLLFIDSLGGYQIGRGDILKNVSSLRMGRQKDTKSSDTEWHIVNPWEVFVFVRSKAG
jgi:hypothetical protein